MTGRFPGKFRVVPYKDIQPSNPLHTVQVANMTAKYDCQSHCQNLAAADNFALADSDCWQSPITPSHILPVIKVPMCGSV
jgi:hypothetical protein